MTQTALVKFQSTHGEVALSIRDIKDHFCPKATDQEARMFLEICRYQGLNPFLKEAYLVKYSESDPASIVVGKEVFTKRAQRLADRGLCLGWEAGIVVARDGKMEQLDGSMSLPGDTLLGGWCRVKRPNQEPFNHTVELSEYIQTTRDGRPTKFWAKMPATMIRKVALVQGLRECFPDDFQGLYDSAEIPGGQVVESTGYTIPQVDGVEESTATALAQGDLGACPEHDTTWFVSETNWGAVQASHKIEGTNEWCRFGNVEAVAFRTAYESRFGEYKKPEADTWLKDNFNGKTWSKMEPVQMLRAVTLLATPPTGPEPDTQPPADAEAPELPPDDAEYQQFLAGEAAAQRAEREGA